MIRKICIIIITLLLITSISFSLIGIMHVDNHVEEIIVDKKERKMSLELLDISKTISDEVILDSVNVNGGIKKIDFDLSNVEFINYKLIDNSNDNVISRISDGNLIVEVLDDELESVTQFEVLSIKDAIACEIIEYNNIYYIYTMTNNNELYVTYISNNRINTRKIVVDNIIGFKVESKDLYNNELYNHFVIIKTSDGKYYTDYIFSDLTEEEKELDYIVREVNNTGVINEY